MKQVEGRENNLLTKLNENLNKGFPTLQAVLIISIISPAEIERGKLP